MMHNGGGGGSNQYQRATGSKIDPVADELKPIKLAKAYRRQASFSYPHFCDRGQRRRCRRMVAQKNTSLPDWRGGKNGRHSRRIADCICSHNGRYPAHTPRGIERIFSHRGGRSPDPFGLHSEYVGQIIRRGGTGAKLKVTASWSRI